MLTLEQFNQICDDFIDTKVNTIDYILWYNECIVNILIKNKKILRNNIYLKIKHMFVSYKLIELYIFFKQFKKY